MLNHHERVRGFGKKEKSPMEVFQNAYDTEVAVAAIVDEFAESRKRLLLNIEMGGGSLAEDRVLLERLTEDAKDALTDAGFSIDTETLETFVETI